MSEKQAREMPIVLSEQHIFDYINCPVLFNLKYVKHIPVEEKVTIKDLLNKTCSSFFTYLYMGRTPTLEMLKRKWDVICEENVGGWSTGKLLDGMGMLHKMFIWASDKDFKVIDQNTKYTLQLHECEMSGATGLYVNNDGNNELLVFDFSEKMTEQLFVDLKLKYSLDAYVFNNIYGKPISGVRVHNVKNNKDFLSIRSNDDYVRVESTINNTAKAIKNSIYYPREVGCHFCNAVNYCKGWSK